MCTDPVPDQQAAPVQHINTAFLLAYVPIVLASFLLVTGCQSEAPGNSAGSEAEAVVLDEYNTILSADEDLVGLIHGMRYDSDRERLFAFDLDQMKILEIDAGGEIVQEYGRRGRGPGEFTGMLNFTFDNEHLYAIDHTQFMHHIFRRDGKIRTSSPYGAARMSSSGGVPDAPRPPVLFNFDNEIYPAPNGNLMRSTLADGRVLYELNDREGNHLADIGEIPDSYDPSQGIESYMTALEQGQVPAYDRARAFPAADRANPGELFLVYGASLKIAKYDTTGRKLWESDIPAVPELDTLAQDQLATMEYHREQRSNDYKWPNIRYVWGTSAPDGDLFLSTYTNINRASDMKRPLWIHRFNEAGELIRRYRLVSEEDARLSPTFAVDTRNRRFLVTPLMDVTLRAYPFPE